MATLLVNTGRSAITGRLKGTTAEPNYIAWGTGAGTTGATDTTLFTETGSRVAGTSTQQTTTTANDTYQVVGVVTTATATTITNAGLFDAAGTGTLFLKTDFVGIALNPGDSIQFTFKISFA